MGFNPEHICTLSYALRCVKPRGVRVPKKSPRRVGRGLRASVALMVGNRGLLIAAPGWRFPFLEVEGDL
jgi:hypothetical protein